MLQQRYGIQTWSEAQSEFKFFDQINNFPMGLWCGLEAGWLLIFISNIALIANRRWSTLLLFSFVITVQVVAAMSVVDITRSMGYLIPSLFVALLILVKEKEINLRRLTVIAAITSLIFLNYYAGGKSSIWFNYPLPIQVVRWLFVV